MEYVLSDLAGRGNENFVNNERQILMDKKQSTAKHERINHSLLGPWERAAVNWFLARVPDWVTPDLLTFIGFVGSICIFAGYLLTNYSPHFLWLASFGAILNWFGDSTDGNLARYRHTERPKYGFFLDHSVDTVSMVMVFVGLGLSPYVKLNLALLGLIGYLLMSIFVYVDTVVNGVFQISFGKLGPTEARAILILANLILFVVGNPTYNLPFIGAMTLYDLIVAGVTILLFTIYLVMISKRLNQLAKLEPLRPYHRKNKIRTENSAEHPAK